MAAVGDHEAEDTRIEIDHLLQVEGVEADVAELSVGQLLHRMFSKIIMGTKASALLKNA
jgi:hypothetical protein